MQVFQATSGDLIWTSQYKFWGDIQIIGDSREGPNKVDYMEMELLQKLLPKLLRRLELEPRPLVMIQSRCDEQNQTE